MNELRGYYEISVHPTRINYYYQPLNRPGNHHKKTYSYETSDNLAEERSTPGNPVASKQPEQFRDNYHYGKISKTAERKINRAIDYITYLAKPKRLPHTFHGKGLSFRLNFITLTLSSEQIHSDNEIMLHIFSPFLNSLRQKWQVHNYIWRAERQSSGGLHYHVVTDRFIPWSELRDVWNRHQQTLGYVSRYRQNQLLWHREGFKPRPDLYKKWSVEKQKKAYHEGCRHDWNSPNSTDVHSLLMIRNVKAYFKKYMTKEGQSSDIEGRLWGCSQELSNITGARAAVYSSIDADLGTLQSDKSIRTFSSEYYTTIFVTIADLERLNCRALLECFDEYCIKRFSGHSPPLRFAA